MRPGHKPKETTHVIHTDGSYSNTPTVEVQPPVKVEKVRPIPGTTFTTKTGSQFMVMDTRGWGLYVSGFPYDVQPRIDDCDFWDWEKYEEEIG
jgi:hypothetical protein